jgi:DNA helicase-2/ATP-dependent DNA helicase PcrA
LLIIAGPGSGKTEIIAWRVAHLIEKNDAPWDKVLVTTFTDKAALELKDRIKKKAPNLNVDSMQISTIHSFCLKILHEFGSHAGIPANLRILDEKQQMLFIFSHREDLNLNNDSDEYEADFFSNIQRAFNLITQELVEPSSLESWCQLNLLKCGNRDSDLWRDRMQLGFAYSKYLDLLNKESLLDFDTLQRKTLTLVQDNPRVLDKIRKHYSWILVDEYQDTDAVQDRILRLLAGDGKRFTAVGDDDQSIYRFRGATVRNILEFKKRFPGARIIKLEQNFRSKKPIVQSTQQVIIHNPARIPKDLSSARGIGSDVLVVRKQSPIEEAKASVNLIKRLHKNGKITSYGDIAILFRSVKYHSIYYIDALNEANIPYNIIGDGGFFRRREISRLFDLLVYLNTSGKWGDRYLLNPLLDLKSETCVALQNTKISLATRDELQSVGINDEGDLLKLEKLLALKYTVQNAEYESILEIFYGILESTGCICSLLGDNNEDALANLGLLSQIVASWDEYGAPQNFKFFLKYLRLLKKSGIDGTVTPAENAIQIMSIHQAKGLEFPVVVMGSVTNGRLPLAPRSDYFEIPYHLRVSGLPEVDDPHLVDERKLFYVAATRARDLLIIGTSDAKSEYGGQSVFLENMLGENLKGLTDFSHAYIENVDSKPHLESVPARHSFSQLSYFLECPLRYKYAVVLGLHVPWREAMGFGDNVHRALEVIHSRALKGQILSPEEVSELVATKWINRNFINTDKEIELKDAATQQISRYLITYGSTIPYVIGAEIPFSFDLDRHTILGKIDLIRRYSENLIELVDFKTSKMPMSGRDIRSRNIRLQLDLYALGAEALGLKITETTAHFMGDGGLATNAWTSERRTQAIANLKSMLNCIDSGTYTPNCDYCAYCLEFGLICSYRK